MKTKGGIQKKFNAVSWRISALSVMSIILDIPENYTTAKSIIAGGAALTYIATLDDGVFNAILNAVVFGRNGPNNNNSNNDNNNRGNNNNDDDIGGGGKDPIKPSRGPISGKLLPEQTPSDIEAITKTMEKYKSAKGFVPAKGQEHALN